MNNNLYKKLLWGTGFVSIVLILTLFIMSQTYIQNLVPVSVDHILQTAKHLVGDLFHLVTDSGVVGMDAAKTFFGAYTTISRADTAWS